MTKEKLDLVVFLETTSMAFQDCQDLRVSRDPKENAVLMGWMA